MGKNIKINFVTTIMHRHNAQQKAQSYNMNFTNNDYKIFNVYELPAIQKALTTFSDQTTIYAKL